MAFGLNDVTIKRIQEVFACFPEIEEVLIYGSRAMGNFRPGSDIDLTIKTGSPGLDLLNRICLQLDDLMLPHLFDVSFFGSIQNPELIGHIYRAGKLFYRKSD